MKTMFTDFSQLPIMLNANELAMILRISRANAYMLMHSQSLKTHRIGKRMLVSKKELMRYLEENSGDY